MAITVIHQLKRIFGRLDLIDQIIVCFLVICFIYPLTLPKYNFGYYNEIDPNDKINKNCNFLNLKDKDILKDVTVVSENIGHLDRGGRYENRQCTTVNQHVGIIVPYRNRSEHLQLFLRHIHPFLIKQNTINYQIFVVEQSDNLPFNRGNLLNIGFHEALQLYSNLNCFVFHDVDILPLDLRQLYTCSDCPRHLCSYLDKFRYVLIYPKLFGGVISISKEQFTRVNGYSNLYSGWGGEDDDFYQRIEHHFGYIERYPKDVGRCVMLSHHQYEEINSSRMQLLKDPLARANADGLTSLNQTYIRKEIVYEPYYVKIKVRLIK